MNNWLKCVCGAAICAAGSSMFSAAQTVTEITLPGERLYTESITSLRDGTLILGSLGKGNLSRIAPGATKPVEWIRPGAGGLNQVFGVLADERSGTLWVCSDRVGNATGPDPALKAFDLKTGTPKGSYALAGDKAFCNDIAIAEDGTAYISDTHQAMLFLLRPGAKALEVAANDPLLESVDGIAFGDRSVLYANGVVTGKLVRIDLLPNGKAGKIVELTPSRALQRPDGMRAIGKNRLLLAENGGTMDIVTFSGAGGRTADIRTIKSGAQGATGVTATRGMAWVAEGKLAYWEDPKFMGQDPGTFKLYAVPLPTR